MEGDTSRDDEQQVLIDGGELPPPVPLPVPVPVPAIPAVRPACSDGSPGSVGGPTMSPTQRPPSNLLLTPTMLSVPGGLGGFFGQPPQPPPPPPFLEDDGASASDDGGETQGRQQQRVDEALEKFKYSDGDSTKTWSRILVEKYLLKYKWYNPQRDDPDAPSLVKGWAYFEHVTLARHIVSTDETRRIGERAVAGEADAPTQLYSTWSTPEKELSGWGIGFGLYFATVRVMGCIFLLVGLLNVANVVYFQSNSYNGDNGGLKDVTIMARGSAVCTDWDWVVCADCTFNDWSGDLSRIANLTLTSTSTAPNSTDVNVNVTTVVKKNFCNQDNFLPGMINWTSLILCIVCLVIMGVYQHAVETRLDEGNTTSSDYSVLVMNPPQDAIDPQEWKDFFEQFAEKQVTLCTIALNNRHLLRWLVKRRILLRNLTQLLPHGTDMKNRALLEASVTSQMEQRRLAEQSSCVGRVTSCFIRCFLRPFGIGLDEATLLQYIDDAEAKIKALQRERYHPTRVFVTFETEDGQRNALSGLSAGRIDIWRNNTDAVAPSVVFRGRVLRVIEPRETTAIRWLDLSIGLATKLLQRVVNLAISGCLMAAGAYIVARTREEFGPFPAAVVISFFNLVIPNVCKVINFFEAHSSEGGKQASMYFKTTVFRWVNTVFLAMFITPFTSTVSGDSQDLIPTIAAIFLAEMVFSPLVNLLDLFGHFRKHVLAPRLKTQEGVNLCFTGTVIHLAERYTEFTKVVLLGFFYSALYPAGFLVGAAIMGIQYFADKYCLLRQWARPPLLGTQLARFSRMYFFSAALAIFSFASGYAWAGFPYDNLCLVPEDGTISAGEGTTEGFSGFAVDGKGQTVAVDIESTSGLYKFCQQNIFALPGFTYPALPRFQPEGSEWMTQEQAVVATLFGWTTVAVTAIWFATVFGAAIYTSFVSVFRATYKPRAENQHLDFSCVKETHAYVPQCRVGGFAFPLLCCDTENVSGHLIGWRDPHNSYDHHNMIYDVPFEGMEGQGQEDRSHGSGVTPSTVGGGQDKEHHPIFALVRHWPPSWALDSCS